MKNILKKMFHKNVSIIDAMPPLKGKVLENQPLNKMNWFGVGGPAQVYVEPADLNDLIRLMQFKPQVPVTVLGGGSNLLIRDGGIVGITIHLGKEFSKITVKGDMIYAGAGASLMELARVAAKQNLTGFEFVCCIPGTIGGGIRMNAGAHGRSLEDVLECIQVVTGEGEYREINPKETEVFGYRTCYLPSDWIFVGAIFKGQKGDGAAIAEKMAVYKKQRENAQPVGVRTAGSTFKNPQGLQAWALIDKAGMRGAKVGGAVVSEKHANFLINLGHATAADIERLAEDIRTKVWEKSGVELQWEVRRVGVHKDKE